MAWRSFFEGWTSSWRSTQIIVASPMSVATASATLASEVTGYGSLLAQSFSFGLGPRVVTGRVNGDYVRIQALRPGMRNSWRPRFEGRLYPTERGCQLVGDLGMIPFVKAFSVLWLGGVGVFFVIGVVGFLGRLFQGNPSKGLPLLGFAAVAVGFAVFFVALTALGTSMGRKDEAFLREWLAERLQERSGPGTWST